MSEAEDRLRTALEVAQNQENVALEKIFTDCETPSTAGKVPVAKLTCYMRDQMSARGSPEILQDLRESLRSVSHHGEVTRKQFHIIARRWLDKIRQRQHRHEGHQDGNNNLSVEQISSENLIGDTSDPAGATTPERETSQGSRTTESSEDGRTPGRQSLESDTTMLQGFLNISTSTIANDIESNSPNNFFEDLSSVDGTYLFANTETPQELRLRAKKCAIDNDNLKGDLQRAEDSIIILEGQLEAIGRELEISNNRCERLQKEVDNQKEVLAAIEKNQESIVVRSNNFERENCRLRTDSFRLKREIDATDLEVRRLNAELVRTIQEKEKQIELRCYYQKELLEKQSRYDAARAHISKIELVNSKLEEKHAISTSTNEHLKTVVKELEDRISELQLHRRYSSHCNESLFGYPTSDDGVGSNVDRLPDLEESFQPSLLDEMKATEYTDTDSNLNDETGESKNLETGENIAYPQYLDALRDANQQIQRAISSLPASCKNFAVSPISFGTDEPKLSELENYNYEEHRSDRMELQRFKFQLHHVLAIISNLSSSKVTIADTKDATTQLDRLDLVPESTPACNIHGDIMNDVDNRIRYRGKRLQKEVYEKNGEKTDCRKASVVEAIRAASSPAGTATSSLISSPSKVTCSSTPRSSPPTSPSTEFHQDSIIAPIVAALDEIIQDTRNAADISSSSSSAGEANQSPVGLRRDHNPRYTFTLPSHNLAKPKEKISLATEDTVLQHNDSSGTELDSVRSTYNLSDRASRCEDEAFESSAWRSKKSLGTDDNTSEDTDITESNSSGGSRVTEDPTYSIHSSSEVLVDSSLQAITESDVIPSESLRYNQQIPPLSRSVTDPDPDYVDRLNSDLKKLTLKTPIMQVQEKTVPKRKSSVYHRSFDCSTLVVAQDQCTIVRRSASSPNVPKSTIPNGGLLQTTHNVSEGKSRKEITAEECESLVDSAADSCCSDKSEFLENTGSFLEMGENMLSVSWRKHSQNEMGDNLEEDDSTCDEAAPTTALENSTGNTDIPILTSTAKPTKSEVSLGNRRTKYVISGTWNLPLPTPSLPPNGEELGDVGSADNAAKWRSSSDREIPVRSRSLARTMSSDEDSSDSECISRDRIDTEEQNLQVVAAEPPPPPPPPLPPPLLPSPPTPLQPQSTVRTNTQTLLRELPLSRGQQNDLQNFSSHNSTVLVCEQLSLSYRDDTDNNDNTAERITAESDRNNTRFKDSERGRRSLSESDTAASCKDGECRCRCKCGFGWNLSRSRGQLETPEEEKRKDLENFGAFPSLPDSRLIELGLADTPGSHGLCERIKEDELERKYTALSIGLGTDRITLPRRMALSLRHRDQAEQNLSTEVDRMQSDIQALAPLCVDRESVERVERVRHQLEMISRCALRVSCTAELLGATHQERRVSRASLLADRYLQALRGRCDKLTTDLAETKRILTENNIVVEENPSELVEDVLPRVRYRGVPSTNRTTISRRRASIATISRPTAANSLQDTTKDSGRPQRISVSGRMTLRRPSLGYDTQRWDSEKLDRTDSSSSSIGELREIFEQAESRRGSREENNNLIRSQSSNFSVGSCESADSDVVWSTTRDDPPGSSLADTKEEESFASAENTSVTSGRTPRALRTVREQVSRLPIFWYILFVVTFFFGFYSNRYVTTRCTVPLKWWSAEELLKRYVHVQRNVPPPI